MIEKVSSSLKKLVDVILKKLRLDKSISEVQCLYYLVNVKEFFFIMYYHRRLKDLPRPVQMSGKVL